MSARRRGGASARAGSQAAPLAVLLLGALGGCSLVVGDIELPPATGLDAALDAATPLDAGAEAGRDRGPDAAPPDAAPPDQQPPDQQPPDLAVDQWVVDAAPDAVVDAAPDAWVEGPHAPVAGTWHLYGLSGRWGSQAGVFEAVLLVQADGTTELRDFEGERGTVAVLAPNDPSEELPWRLDITPFGQAATGVLDPVSGLGVLTAPDAVVFAVRLAPEVALPTGAVTALVRAPMPQGAVYGAFAATGAEPPYQERARVDQDAQARRDVWLTATADGQGRYRLEGEDETLPVERRVTPIEGGRGAIGRSLEAAPDDPRYGLWMAFGQGANERPNPWPAAQRFFCGGLARDGGGTGAVVRGRVAQLNEAQTLTWAVSGESGQLVYEGGVGLLRSDTGGYFDTYQSQVLAGAEGRSLVLFDTDTQTHFGWGLGLCVSLAPAE